MYQATSIVVQSLHYFGPENCAWCGAVGAVDGVRCPSCTGIGYVLTLQPGLQCPGCDGSGRSPECLNSAVNTQCVVCEGCGWLICDQR
jgi:hypothetical protein